MMKQLAFTLGLICTTVFAGSNYMKNGKFYLYLENENNVVECSINQLCDIELLNGDSPDHWIMSDGEVWKDSISSDRVPSYRDNAGNTHVIIQSAGISTGKNSAILVGKSYSYHLNLTSVKKAVTNKYVFIEDATLKFKNDGIMEESIDFSQISRKDTQYYLKGDTDSYIAPVEVFNDGKKTYIQMPKDITTQEMPSIKGFSPQGRLEEALCRYKHPYYICDGLYPRLAVILGSEENIDDIPLRVNIYHGKKPSGWKWLIQQYPN